MPAPTTQAKSTTEIANAGFSHLQTTKSSTAGRISPDFLVLVLDINPIAWTRQAELRSKGKARAITAEQLLEDAVSAVMIFLNAHIAMQHENGLALYAAAGTGKAQLLYSTAPFSSKNNAAPRASSSSSASASNDRSDKPDANTYLHFKLVDDKLSQGIKNTCALMLERSLQAESSSSASGSEAAQGAALARSVTIGIVSALSQALCHLNRLGLNDAIDAGGSAPGSAQTRAGGNSSASQTSGSGFRSRILVLSATQDASTQYIPMMNCIFAAQKKAITIDVCKLFGQDTVFLQQAAYLTGGTYFRLDGGSDGSAAESSAAGSAADLRASLVQTLLTTYLPSRSMRTSMNLPTLEEIDFRAACFCHRKIVDIGYICSVCLSLFCQPRPNCLTCKSKFPKHTIQRYTHELEFTDPWTARLLRTGMTISRH
ncbi:transcription factor Tfb4 [Testicularia cyperi]|uniref:General transcription and DNA repair factor IIH subunit TFB4 n=1 Tax=Testicularia cyperi TaxID=1882483 RepID=A0A317XRL6_9BASI|nr:transcription factor Tfb4 [Testicularia cyperi]